MSVSIWYADGAHAPSIAPRAAARLAGVPDDARLTVTLGLYLERHEWFDDPDLDARSVMVGYGSARAASNGAIASMPVRLSAIPSMIVSEPPDVAVIGAVRRGEQLVLPGTIGWADVLARVARRVVVEVDEAGHDYGNEPLPGNIVASCARAVAPAPMRSRPPDEVDLAIGSRVAAAIPDDATLQFGPGAIGEAIVRAIDRPTRIWSGLITDPVAALHDRGLLVDRAVGAYLWGGDALERLSDAGRLRMVSSTVTHDLSTLSAMPRLVACNTAIQVGLDGAVNVERVAGRTVSSIGGHADFCAGALALAGRAVDHRRPVHHRLR